MSKKASCAAPELTQARLRELLDYNPETGVFVWKMKASMRTKIGSVAGSSHCGRYLQVKVQTKKYLMHRLAWFYSYGVWPANEIDHINGNKIDNRLDNLREASRSQNEANKFIRIDSASRIKGVCWKKQNKKWKAEICVNKKRIYLGYYDTSEDAQAAYCAAACLHFGEFARAA
jgi:HNH endonuclease/AP2 domain